MKFGASVFIGVLFCGAALGQDPQPTPQPIREEVVVTATATETKLGDTPASIVVFSRREVTSSAAPTLDDVLRQAAGFSNFRRSSSRNANPTTQGVSLRGVGSSGASRSVILFDGVPLNDPFGGWVQWNRVSPVGVESVEMLRGGASNLYGDSGLSGAIGIAPRRLDRPYLVSLDMFGGTQYTLNGSGFAGFKRSGWTADMTVTSFQTKGYIPIDEAVRGPADVYAGVRSSNFAARISREIGRSASIFFRPSYFGEVRTNGTGLQTNRTHIRQFVLGGDVRSKAVLFDWRLYGGTQVFDQVFSAVNAARTSESLTRVQRSPVQNIGFSAKVTVVIKDHTLVAGVDARNVRGASDEIAYAANLPTALVGSGGRQTGVGVFAQDLIKIGKRAVVVTGIRFDDWKNYAGLSSTRTFSTNAAATNVFPDRSENALSPRISFLYHLNDRFSFYASASRSFRGPTLNELYRGFRVGSVLTLANENLKAEHANNVEGGVSFGEKRTFIRANGFWTSIDQPVSNVTLTTTPSMITRQRQNAGTTRSRGFEAEAETGVREFTISLGYLFADSTVASFPSNPALVGLRIPQVPKHQFTFQARYSPQKWTLALQGRASSSQYDDDLNQFRLEPYAQIDLFASRRIKEDLQIYAAVENIFNSRYSVAKTPIRSVSAPTTFRLGLRWK